MSYISREAEIKFIFLARFSLDPRPADQIATYIFLSQWLVVPWKRWFQKDKQR